MPPKCVPPITCTRQSGGRYAAIYHPCFLVLAPRGWERQHYADVLLGKRQWVEERDAA